MSVIITDEMIQASKKEANRREPYINHHFELAYMKSEMRNQIGFLGEFACKEELGLDWRIGIRENYEVPDMGDILNINGVVDIKTETIPFNRLMDLVKKKIGDDEPYGRRLINQDQVPLLEHYDYVVWGALPRFDESYNNLKWYSLGYLEAQYILEHYEVTQETPFGTRYTEPCLNIRNSELKSLYNLKKILHNA